MQHDSSKPQGESSGLLSPPSSQHDQDSPSSGMLMSPPPEESLWLYLPRSKPTPSTSASASPPTSGVAFNVGFTGKVISNTLATKRKRGAASNPSTSVLPDAGVVPDAPDVEHVNPPEATPNPKPRKLVKHNASFAPQSLQGRSPRSVTPTRSPRKHGAPSPTKQMLVSSPHADNPMADYLPPLPSFSREHASAHTRRRSSTPTPKYEPPSERFTPPREVIHSPTTSTHTPKTKTSRRKPVAKSGKKLVMQIKKEFPDDIDLTAPPPPPSPTDDPLLLRGPAVSSRRRRSQLSRSSGITPSPSSPPLKMDVDGTQILDLTLQAGDLSDEATTDAPPMIGVVAGPGADDDWSDSDRDFDQSGDYTGKFKIVAVPTKNDPPSSGTRKRMEAWGRPISPFPRPDVAGEGDITDSPVLDATTPLGMKKRSPYRRSSRSPSTPYSLSFAPAAEPIVSQEPPGPFDFDSPTPDAASDPRWSPLIVPPEDPPGDGPEFDEQCTWPTRNDSNAVPSSSLLLSPHSGPEPAAIPNPGATTQHHSEHHSEVPQTPLPNSASRFSVRLFTTPSRALDQRESDDMQSSDDGSEDEEDESSVVRELSQPPDLDGEETEQQDDGLSHSFAQFSLLSSPNPFDVDPRLPPYVEDPSLAAAHHAQGYPELDDDDDDLADFDTKVIKITSDDPRAAAQAAAILKLHQYDCIEQPRRQRRGSHGHLDSIFRRANRRSVTAGGVSKSSGLSRRRTLGGVVGDRVFIPGSPVMTLPQLLQEAEASLRIEDRSSTGSPFGTFTPSMDYQTPDRNPSLYKTVLRSKVAPDFSTSVGDRPREWCRDDWKKMDSCYTDERLAAGALEGLELAPADEVDLDRVVDRFVDLIGGPNFIGALGFKWTRDDLLKRARALQRKQCSGRVAPPTPSRSASVLSNDSASGSYHRYMSPAMAPISHPLNSSQRSVDYSHLLNDALAVSDSPAKPTLSGNTSSSSIANRVKGFLFSYLPLSKNKPTPAPPKVTTQQAGLPLPPPDLFLRPRHPITTPMPKAPSKASHPKDQVQLHPAPLPEKLGVLPEGAPRAPCRLVELHHISPPLEDKPKQLSSSLRGRRDSNSSVKDLVRSFEDMERQVDPGSRGQREPRTRMAPREGSTLRKEMQRPAWRP